MWSPSDLRLRRHTPGRRRRQPAARRAAASPTVEGPGTAVGDLPDQRQALGDRLELAAGLSVLGAEATLEPPAHRRDQRTAAGTAHTVDPARAPATSGRASEMERGCA